MQTLPVTAAYEPTEETTANMPDGEAIKVHRLANTTPNDNASSNRSSNKNSMPALCNLFTFLSQTYDYLIIGGGTAGLCLAARLTESPQVKVGVLEAGKNEMDDPQIYTPSLYPTLIGREKYDWCFESIPQPNAAGKTYSMPRGKVLGGSSAINYLMYVRGSKADYDNWGKILGSKEWTWDGLLPYFRKHQSLDYDSDFKPDGEKNPQYMPHAARGRNHGTDGPIHTSFNDYWEPFEEDFVTAAHEVGGTKRMIEDAWSGDHMGFYSSLASVSRAEDQRGKRSYAATGYFKPNAERKNLFVLTEAHCSRILLEHSEQKGGIQRAVGVEFLHDGQKHHVKTEKEVLLCAGAIQSPQMLELSGIGDPYILKKAGVECKVQSNHVGANFQDHVLGGMLFDLKDGTKSLDSLQDPEYAKAQQAIYDRTGSGPYGSPGMLMGFASYASISTDEEVKKTIEEVKKHSLASTNFGKAQEKVLVDQLNDPTFANLQAFCIGCQLDVSAGHSQVDFFSPPPLGKTRISPLICLEHPLSRGSVHIKSLDPCAAPEIDPGYFQNEADAKILAAGIKWLDGVTKHPKMKQNLGKRILPPEGTDLDTEDH